MIVAIHLILKKVPEQRISVVSGTLIVYLTFLPKY